MDRGRRDLAPVFASDRALDQTDGRALPPLAVSGLVVTKAAWMRSLRVYVPQFAGLEPLDGGRSLLRSAERE